MTDEFHFEPDQQPTVINVCRKTSRARLENYVTTAGGSEESKQPTNLRLDQNSTSEIVRQLEPNQNQEESFNFSESGDPSDKFTFKKN